MTNEIIKEEFKKWQRGVYTEEEGIFAKLFDADNFTSDDCDLISGFYAGFRAAESYYTKKCSECKIKRPAYKLFGVD